MINKLNNRFIAIFLIFSLLLIGLIHNFSRTFIKNSFNKYVESTLENKKNTIKNNIEHKLLTSFNKSTDIEHIGVDALENGLMIRVVDNTDDVIWDARVHNNGMCNTILSNMNANMKTVNPNEKGEYIEDSYNLASGDTLFIGYYGPIFYDDFQILFFKTLDKALIILSVIFLILSLLFGIVVSNSINKPILKVINNTKLISKGNYSVRDSNKYTIIELEEMKNSINTLASVLESDDLMRKRLTKDISHELRTPLSTILGQIEAIKDGLFKPTPERLDSISEEILRLSRLVNSLEQLTRYDEKDTKLNLESINLNLLLSTIVNNFEQSIKSKNISLKLDLKPINLMCDKDKLSQAIINIVSNSLKYTDFGGKISISSYTYKNNTVISIKDSGIGILEKDIPYIFDRFYRADESRCRDTGGNGIGLSISLAIIKAHGGDITVESSYGHGSTFNIIL